MNFLNKVHTVLWFCLVFGWGFSQEYDFDIPEEEESKLELNGNLDTKWGLLHTRKSSSFYGVQFYDDSEKDDYLSQYRLDFYLDGNYQYKQVGFFMKTFYQYARDESVAPSFFELYGSLNFSPRLSMSIGKRRFNWGKGYAFNPVGYVNAEKDPENPDLALAGYTSVYFNYNKSFNSHFLQNFSFSTVLLPPESDINKKFASTDKIGIALKLYFLLNNIDIDVMAAYRRDDPFRVGMDFATNVRDNLEIHAELSYVYDEIKHFIADEVISRHEMDGYSYLLGLRFLNRFNTTLIAEYYHNNNGLSKNEFTSYVNYLQYSVDSNIPELINSAKVNMSAVFQSKTLMQDYFYLRLNQPEPFSWLYTSISLFSIYNLNDNSFLVSAQLGCKPYTNFEFILWPFFFFGKEDTEYGAKPFQKKIEIWMRFYF